MPKRVNPSYFFLLGMLSLALSACDSSSAPSDLHKFVDNTRQNAKINSKNKQSKMIVPPLPAVYQAAPLRAPFENQTVQTTEKKVAATPLQAYPVNMLKLVGTVTQGSRTFAYVIAPDQLTYRVDQGDQIGDHEGIVTSIQPGRVNIMEEDTDSDSDKGNARIQRVVTLEIKEAQ